MQKNSDIKKSAAVLFYIAAAVLFLVYIAADFIPGFLLSTAGRLVLLCLCCAFLWFGGFLFYKAGRGSKAMKINLRVYLALFILLFVTLTLFDPLWGRSGNADFVWTKELFAAYAENSLNLVPFRTTAEYFTKGDLRQFIVNVAGNVVCLMPLGILLPLNFEKQKRSAIFLVTCAVIVIAVELLQFITLAGSCDIDDLILNVSGAFLVYLAAKTKNIEKFLRFAFLMEK